MEYMIGVDIGTTSTKAVLYDEKAKVLANANVAYPLYQEEPEMAEQDPEEIFAAVVTALTKVTKDALINKSDIKGVSFSAAMHSLILLDEKKQALTRVMTWADNRAAKYSQRLKESDLGAQIYKRTGTPIHPMAPLSKLIWLKAEEPELMAKAHYFIGIKEYVLNKFFNQLQVDISIASATGLFNTHTLDWDELALETAGISRKQLPKLVATTAQLTNMAEQYALQTGLPKDIIFIMGANDGVLSNLGLNAIEKDVVAITIGTSGAVRTVIDKPKIDPKGRLFCYVLDENHYVLGGSVNNGGNVFRWIREQLFSPEKEAAEEMKIDSYELLMQMAATVPAGADGLLFLPYLGGERAPLWNAQARATYFGLNHTHTRAHMMRAALEGVIFNLYMVFLALEEVSGRPQEIQATGGFSRSDLWRQMLADIFATPVSIPESFESSCLGAAVVGWKSLGKLTRYQEVAQLVGAVQTHQPQSEKVAIYRELLPIFTRVSGKLVDEYQAIADYQRSH